MTRILTALRYSLFFILAACFAAQISLATWNLQIERSLTRHDQLDVFLITTGTLGLLLIFPVTFVDIIRKNSLLSRVWFEASWLALFFLMETAGAAALTALLPQLSCTSAVPSLHDPACSSTSALAGISWTLTVVLVVYMTSLLISAILHQDEFPHVWATGVRDFPWFESTNGKRLPSSPCSPRRRRSFILNGDKEARTQPSLVVPKPRRAQAPPLWTTYEIEHYQAQDVTSVQPQTSNPSEFPPQPAHAMRQLAARPVGAALSLYPPHLSLPPVGNHPVLPAITSSTSWRAPGDRPSPTDSDPTTPKSQRQSRGHRGRPPPLNLSLVTNHR